MAKWFMLWIVFTVFILIKPVKCSESRRSVVQRMLRDYDPNDPPRLDSQTEVKIGMYVMRFDFEEESSELHLAAYLRQSWNDPRLKHSNTTIRLNSETEVIWLPDTFFRNEIVDDFPETNFRSDRNALVRVNGNGDVWFVMSMFPKVHCHVEWSHYPYDKQSCSIKIESFGHTMDALSLSWLNSAVEIDANSQLNEFDILDKVLINCSQVYTTGTYPCLEIRFVIERIGLAKSRWMIEVYVPSVVLVLLSSLAFWMNPDFPSGRLPVGLVTTVAMLLLCLLKTPDVGAVTRLHYWLVGCFLFVIGGVIQTAILSILEKGANKDEQVKTAEKSIGGVRLTVISFLAFLAAFLIFVIGYAISCAGL